MNSQLGQSHDFWPIDSNWFESLGIPAFALDTNGIILGVNRRLRQKTVQFTNLERGVLFSEILGSQEERNKWGETLSKSLELKEVTDCLLQLPSPFMESTDGHQDKPFSVWDVRVSCNTNESGLATGAICFVNSLSKSVTATNSETVPAIPDVTQDDYRQGLVESKSPMFGLDSSGGISLWNSEMESLTGFTMAEVLGTSFQRRHVAFVSSVVCDSAIEQVLTKSQPENCEIVLRLKDGSLRCVLLLLRPVLTEGAIETAVCTVQVMNDATCGLAQGCELQTFFDKGNVLLVGVNKEGNINEWNDACAASFGCSRLEAAGLNFIETFVELECRDEAEELQNDIVRGRGVVNCELTMQTKSGEEMIILTSAIGRKDLNDELHGTIYMSHDITEAVKHGTAISSVAGELRRLIDTANAPIFGVDCAG